MRLFARFLLAAGAAALLVVSAWLLDRFAQWQFTTHLRDQGAHALALAAHGESPYRWTFDNRESIVAGRVFGAAEFHFDGGELIVRSSGAPFDIGMLLPRPIDLALFPQLRIDATGDAPAQLSIAVYESLDAAERVLAGSTIVPGAATPDLDLAAASWGDRRLAGPAPRRAAVLRLRFALPPSSTLHIRSAALLRAARAAAPDLRRPPQIVAIGTTEITGTAVLRLPSGSGPQQVDIAAIADMYTEPAQALILLPQRARVEQQMVMRNAVFSAVPGAILIPERAIDETFAQARREAAGEIQTSRSALHWYLGGIYIALLIWSRVRPLQSLRAHAAVEALLALAGPLWLIIGEPFDGKPDAFQQLLIGASVVYAIALAVPRQWRWNGSRHAWLLALAVVLAATLAALVLHDPQQPVRAIDHAHVARYLVWALLQQFLICAVCTERWHVVSGSRAVAVYLGALGFALLHTPNAALMLATLLGGLCWCALYLRERALLPLAFSHAASALLLLALLPRSILASAEVSARFFQ